MAVTKEQIEATLRAIEAKKADPTISDSERARLRADAVKLSAAYRSMGTATQTSPLTTAADPANTNFWADTAKTNFTDFIYRALSNANQTVADEVFGIDAPTDVIRSGVTPEEVRQADAEYEALRRQAIQDKAATWFGSGNRMPENNLQRYGGIALGSIAADPVMSVLGGRGVLGVGLNLAGSGTAAMGGAVGYDTLSATAEALGASPEWQQTWGQIGGTVAGLISGTSAGLVGGSLESVAQARNVVRQQKGIQDSLDKASDFLVTSNMKTVIDDIVTTEPNIDQHINTLRVMSELIPNFEVAPGIALYDNAIVRKNMETLLKESPKFRASVEANLKDVGNAILLRRDRLFGTTDPDEIRRNLVNARDNYGINLDNAVRRRDQIDQGIDRVLTAARTEAEPIQVGTAARRLIDAKEAAVKQEMNIQYEKLIKDYTAQGMVFPKDSVGNLWNLVSGALDAKLFTPFPTLVGKVNQLLRPQIVPATEAMPSLGAMLGGRTGPVRTPETTQFRDLSLEQLDSLKQELNKALRNSYGQTSYPLLRQMKEALTAEIDKMPGFGEAYRATDRSFYQKLGIPFDAAGLSQLDSLKFTETVGNYLAKPERARDFLSFVGDQGIPVVRDAILMRLRRTAFDTEGNFKPANYAKFLAENKTLLDTVPGLRAELSNIGGTVARMDAVKSRLDSQYNQYAEDQANNILRAVHASGIDSAINDMIVSPMKLDQYSRTVRNLDPESARTVRQGIRSALINKAFSTPSARDFINQNATLFNEWFGSTYTESLQALSFANDMLRRIDPDKMAFAPSFKEADALAKSTGTSAPQFGSLMRDRISSGAHKASILFSRWFTMRTAGRRDQEMMDLLLNPEGLKRIADTARLQRENKIDINEAAKRVSEVMAASVLSKASLATQGAETAERTPKP